MKKEKALKNEIVDTEKTDVNFNKRIIEDYFYYLLDNEKPFKWCIEKRNALKEKGSADNFVVALEIYLFIRGKEKILREDLILKRFYELLNKVRGI